MALKKRMTLLKRTILWLSAICLVSFALLAFVVWQVRETIRNNGLMHIQKILNHKLNVIDRYTDQRYAAFNNLNQHLSFASLYNNIFDTDFWTRNPPCILQNSLADFTAKNSFYDVFLITADGDVVYTVKHENDLHTNLLNGPHRHTQLARVFRDALKNTKPYISDFNYYEPSKDYAAFIAEPITVDGKTIGVSAVQIDGKTIFPVINDYRELGKTGQVIASVIHNGQLMSMTPIRNSDVKPYSYYDSPQNSAIRDALSGGRGQAYMLDRSGHDVAVAWDYQNDLRWGLAVQINESELLASWYRLSTFLIFLFFSGTVIVGMMVIMAFRSFAKPIKELSDNAQMMSQGNYDIRLNADQYDYEWQVLIRVFQHMAVEISRKMAQLNEQNELLSAQKQEIEELNLNLEEKIKKKSSQLQEYIDIVDKYVITSQTDIYGNITYASEAFCHISGYTKEELIGNNHRITRHPDMPTSLFDDLWATIRAGKTWQGEIKNMTSDGHYFWAETMISPNMEEGKIVGYTAVRHDITNQKIIEELVITDSMTGLYNRRHYVNVMQDEMNRVKRHGSSLALMMIDVDHFKNYNDTYGHQEGDKILNQVADVLKEYTSRSGEYAFRLGGEEFAVVVSAMSSDGYVDLAQRICRAIEALALIHEKNDAAPYVTVSIGIAQYSHDYAMTCEELYKEADMQLYLAKNRGRNQVAVKR